MPDYSYTGISAIHEKQKIWQYYITINNSNLYKNNFQQISYCICNYI